MLFSLAGWRDVWIGYVFFFFKWAFRSKFQASMAVHLDLERGLSRLKGSRFLFMRRWHLERQPSHTASKCKSVARWAINEIFTWVSIHPSHERSLYGWRLHRVANRLPILSWSTLGSPQGGEASATSCGNPQMLRERGGRLMGPFLSESLWGWVVHMLTRSANRTRQEGPLPSRAGTRSSELLTRKQLWGPDLSLSETLPRGQ